MNDFPLTYEGALRILGRHDRPAIERLDKILGGVLLGAGALAGLGAIGLPMVVPIAALTAIWGWVDQKSEAIALIRGIADGLARRTSPLRGLERHNLVIAAHTTIAGAALFETFEELVGRKALRALDITAEDQERLVTGRYAGVREAMFLGLYRTEVPAPSSARGFVENTPKVMAWFVDTTSHLQEFLNGLEAWSAPGRQDIKDLPSRAIERYRSHYFRLAAEIPEFLVWTSVNEHASTRVDIAGVRVELQAAMAAQQVALGRIEQLLALIATTYPTDPDLFSMVHRANAEELGKPIVPADAERYRTAVEFPTIGSIYIDPAYRMSPPSGELHPARESWWRDRPVHENIDLALFAYLTSADGLRTPLLLLGDPGAGKSMLTRVLAARLPSSGFTAVRVPLRRVSAVAPIHQQIQTALDLLMQERVKWLDLSGRERSTKRVIILDGLDELIQATGDNRRAYLLEIVEFQRQAARDNEPTYVIVTSRTVVADRVEIPEGTLVMKLEDFDERRIGAWLQRWNDTNSARTATGAVRPLSVTTALHQSKLAGQPLLLLMLALYSADPAAPALDSELSAARLYRQLLDNFTRRELSKDQRGAAREVVTDLLSHRLRDLSVTALAMFNRGRLDVNELDLASDMAGLSAAGTPQVRPGELSLRIIRHFFFVHAATARFGASDVQRSYEFLHATIGEYLVAHRVLEVLAETADAALGGRRGPREPDDDFLYALMSHQPLAARANILTFAAELFAEMPTDEQARILRTAEILLVRARQRPISDRYSGYMAESVDRLRRLAAYAANLVLLRVVLAGPDGTPVDHLFRDDPDNAVLNWRSNVNLWRAGLDPASFQVMLSALQFDGTTVAPGLAARSGDWGADPGSFDTPSLSFDDAIYARLLGEFATERRLRTGYALRESAYYATPTDRWFDVVSINLEAAILGGDVHVFPPINRYEPPDEWEIAEVARRICTLIRLRGLDLPGTVHGAYIQWLVDLNRPDLVDSAALALTVMRAPVVLDNLPQLRQPEMYRDPALAVLLFSTYDDHAVGAKRIRRLRSAIEDAAGLTPFSFDDATRESMRTIMSAFQANERPGDPDDPAPVTGTGYSSASE